MPCLAQTVVFIVGQHNEIRELTANFLMQAVCEDVLPVIELVLQPVFDRQFFRSSTNTAADVAMLDIAMNGFWQIGKIILGCTYWIRLIVCLPVLDNFVGIENEYLDRSSI